MDGRHSTPYELIEALYGIGNGGEHIQKCAACAERLAAMQERRRHSLADAGFSDAELAAQSRRWRDRVESRLRPSRPLWSWRVAAVSAMVLVGVAALAPREQRQAQPDDQALFEDAFRMAVSVEPASFAPIENLFERSRQ
jgi:anti-sigma factor RsiW